MAGTGFRDAGARLTSIAPCPAPGHTVGMSIDDRLLRDALGLFVTGVTVITARGSDGEPVGVTANSFNSVSLDPPLILWSLALTARSLPVFEAAEHFAVHILHDDQTDLAECFARAGHDKFAGLDITGSDDGPPLLANCAARLNCRTYARHPGGDHIVIFGEVLEIERGGFDSPLVFHGGRYAGLTDKN